MEPCPKDWRPTCSCSSVALEPDENCGVHGYPDPRRCPYCGQMRGHNACKRCGCEHGLPDIPLEEIFTAVTATPCGHHEDVPVGQRGYYSCGCGLADAGCYIIQWHGNGLGLVCDSKEDGDRKAYMMNVAWNLAMKEKK